jgi:hypothetical protein
MRRTGPAHFPEWVREIRGKFRVRYLRLTGVACMLVLSGCDLGYLDGMYNLTSCPIRLKVFIQDRNTPDYEPYVVAPGDASLAIVAHRADRFSRIVVIDHKNAEYRYDAAALALLRPPGASNEYWGYADSGLVYLRDDPKRSDLDKLAKEPCGEPQ